MPKNDSIVSFFSSFPKNCTLEQLHYMKRSLIVLNLIHCMFSESFNLFGLHLQVLDHKKYPKKAQDIQQITLMLQNYLTVGSKTAGFLLYQQFYTQLNKNSIRSYCFNYGLQSRFLEGILSGVKFEANLGDLAKSRQKII